MDASLNAGIESSTDVSLIRLSVFQILLNIGRSYYCLSYLVFNDVLSLVSVMW